MATHIVPWLPLFVLFLGGGAGGHSAVVNGSRQTKAGDLAAVYRSEVGVREATGRNDGPRIAEYLRYCGLPEKHEWCAAFVSWCHGKAGYPEPRNAWAAALFPSDRIVWRMDDRLPGNRWSTTGDRAAPRQGDVFGIYIARKKRIAHCGFVDGWDDKYCLTVEGNVDNAVVRKRRPIWAIRAVVRWTSP